MTLLSAVVAFLVLLVVGLAWFFLYFIDRVGQLPETHLHCAQLAEITLQRSLENYLEKGRQAPENTTKS